MPSYRLTYDDFGHPWLHEEISGDLTEGRTPRKPTANGDAWSFSPGASDYTEPARDDRPRSTPFQFAPEVSA